MKSKIRQWELWGIAFIAVFGTTLHFWFEWSGYLTPVALIAAVNESTWEHFKMAFWPGFFWAFLEYFKWGRDEKNFFPAKLAGLFSMPLITTILFYGYTAFLHHNLPADIMVFLASVASGQFLSLKILTVNKTAGKRGERLSFLGMAVLVLLFSLLTYFPLKNFLFEHPENTGQYGILESYEHHDDH